ncbi:tyrosine-type recombinase/integrase [bacterium]|nr:tyrosine-type recombinase/integrase [bacterium]
MSSRGKNERVKRQYFKRLREADGLSEMTISCKERSIALYDEFCGNQDYVKFNQKLAVQFKSWLKERRTGGKPLSLATVHNHLRQVAAFLTWLSGQPGYKSSVKLDAVSFLNLDRKSTMEAVAPRPVRLPSLSYVKELVRSIPGVSDVERRDRALIAFLLVSGMRDSAIASLPLGCFDRDSLMVHQDPRQGVKTKFNKTINTRLMHFDSELISIVCDWAEYLEQGLLFGSTDPLFPRTRVEQCREGLSFEATGLEPAFWSGGGTIRRILRERATAAGLDYYKPHSFRHAAVHLAMSRCRTAREMKSVSQNIGHEHIGTTIMTYGTLDSQTVLDVVSRIDFEGAREPEMDDQELDRIIQLLQQQKRSGRNGLE